MTASLLVGEKPIGVLHMAFRHPRTFDEADRSFMQTLARQCAQALERTNLYEQEREAREQAERLASRLRRLQTVVDATFTGGSLDQLLEELLLRLREAVGSDTATILIVDETGDALIARKAVGFDQPLETHVPIGEGFAGTIAATLTHLVVPDISEIHVVSRYLRESGIVSLAGVPLVAEGRLVGVAHVGSKTRREFDREDMLLLRLVAGRAAVAIDRARLHEREHRIAEVLQRSLLPERLPSLEGVEVAARYVPGTVGVAVGGDWYDVFELGDGSIGIAVGDVVGHGVRAAATMGRLRNVLRAYAVEGFGPAEALGRLNRLACEGTDETFATVVYALVGPARTSVRLASAGHPPVLVRSRDGTVRVYEEGRSLPVGAAPDALYAEVELRLDPGSTLVLYTDGLVERRSESIDMGIARLARLVEGADGPLDELADRIVMELESADHTDDVALLAVQFETLTPTRFSLRFPAEPRALAPMRGSLRSWLEGHGAREEDIFDILVAVNEACSNAVEHPLGGAAYEVALDAELVDGHVSIVVRDQGRWRPAGPRGDRGRGLDFMSALMEEVDISRSDDGTTVHLTRRLHRSAP
jgi:serine phosphatase RsbU (regulator of sigma subunit)